MSKTAQYYNYILQNIHDYSINIPSREIFLHGYVSEEDGVDYRVAAQFQKNLHCLNGFSKNEITVHMSIAGGCWVYGMSIYDCIKLSPSYTTIVAYAAAESMSSIILQAADRRILAPNTEFMIHYGELSIDADHKTVSSTVEWNNKLAKTMLDIYVDKCQNGPYFTSREYTVTRIRNFLKKKMDQNGDWFMSAEEAINLGFADEIYTGE